MSEKSSCFGRKCLNLFILVCMKYLAFCLIALFVWSCGPSQRELAVWKTNQARELIAQGDSISALNVLDSIAILYPKAEVQIAVARNMSNDLLNNLINARTLQLELMDTTIANLEKLFVKEKTVFDRYTQYVPHRQTFARSWKRSYLLVNLDERGELFLTSNYMGKEWLNHTAIRVYDGDLQAKSGDVPLDDPMNNQSDFMELKWEKVAYTKGRADSVIQFIAQHPDRKLKCVFLGNRQYYILLEEFDVKAVIDALALSNAIKGRQNTAAELEAFKKRRGDI